MVRVSHTPWFMSARGAERKPMLKSAASGFAPKPPLPSNGLRTAPVDNTERRLDRRERHVVGHYRLGKTLEGERAKLFSCDAPL